MLESFIDGKRVPSHRGRRLHEILRSSRRRTVDIDGQWKGVGRNSRPDTRLRAVLPWNERRNDHIALVTNLDRKRFPPDTLMQLYRLRWQIELVFKEWKSHCDLHAFMTTKAPIAEGLMWAALMACTVKRFMAKATQRAFQHAEISTRKTAMTIGHHLFTVLNAILASRGVKAALRRLLMSPR